MNKKILLGTCLAAALAIAGCRTTETVYIGDTARLTPSKWVQTDDDVREYAKIASVRHDRHNGLLRVQVDLENTRRKEQRIVYRFVWLDEKGFEISSIQGDWLPRIVGGHETVQLVGIAPDPRVTDCIVKIKESMR